MALKGNQGTLADEVEEAFIDGDAKDYAGLDAQFMETSERDHGRLEPRRYRTLGTLDGVSRSALWKGLDMIGMVQSEREVDGKRSTEYRFYIGTIGTHARRFARAVRGHWGSRTLCTGALMLPSARTSRGSVTHERARTSPCFAISL